MDPYSHWWCCCTPWCHSLLCSVFPCSRYENSSRCPRGRCHRNQIWLSSPPLESSSRCHSQSARKEGEERSRRWRGNNEGCVVELNERQRKRAREANKEDGTGAVRLKKVHLFIYGWFSFFSFFLRWGLTSVWRWRKERKLWSSYSLKTVTPSLFISSRGEASSRRPIGWERKRDERDSLYEFCTFAGSTATARVNG